jgi:hypothetical protein
MSITVEDKETSIKIYESDRKIMVGDFDDGSHMSIFFPGGHASVAMTREETEALIAALQLAIS